MQPVPDRDPDLDADADSETGATASPGAGDAGRPVTVALLHPDASRRALLERKLDRSPGIEVILSDGDLVEGIEHIVDHLPDVVALYPTEELLEAVDRLQRDVPGCAVLVLDPGPEHFGALALGAAGTLPSGGSEITKAVLGVAGDETVLTAEWAAALRDAVDELPDRVRRLALLTETERDVLGRLAEGWSPREIADDNEVTERLVNLHIGYAVAKYQRATEALRTVEAHELMRAAEEAALESAPGSGAPAD